MLKAIARADQRRMRKLEVFVIRTAGYPGVHMAKNCNDDLEFACLIKAQMRHWRKHNHTVARYLDRMLAATCKRLT